MISIDRIGNPAPARSIRRKSINELRGVGAGFCGELAEAEGIETNLFICRMESHFDEDREGGRKNYRIS